MNDISFTARKSGFTKIQIFENLNFKFKYY